MAALVALDQHALLRLGAAGHVLCQRATSACRTLIGEATGGKPDSYGELRSFRLPNSGLSVSCSTKYFRLLEEDPPAMQSDVLVEIASEDPFSGTDRVPERALEFKPGDREH
ncbi:MAG: hypothetical protein ACI8QZ_003642 [Chlamydiales bacterium]